MPRAFEIIEYDGSEVVVLAVEKEVFLDAAGGRTILGSLEFDHFLRGV